MNEVPSPANPLNKWLKLFLKIAITTLCLWYVSGKIDFAKAGTALGNADWLLLFLALIAFIISKLVAAIRLNIYFRNISIYLSFRQNLKLYWLGMFYNLFLPGSIGGDAYKVILLTKRFKVPYKKTTAAVLLDRISGLLGLFLLLTFYAIQILPGKWYLILIIAGTFVSIVGLYFVLKLWLKDFVRSFFSTLMLGIVVQVMQIICVYLIMLSLGVGSPDQYMFIFLVSSVVAVLPLTIGGLGIREVVFLEGAKYFGLMQETSVVISLLFYLITLVTSAVGAIYVFRDPLKK